MKNTRLLVLAILGLLGLLVLLGSLQYVWLGEISRSERENLQNRLNADIKRFAGDFNSELRWAYFSFQIDPADWLKEDWTVFNQRYRDWKLKTSYPTIIKDIYFVSDSAPLRYDADLQTFKTTELTDELAKVKATFEENKKLNAADALVVNTYFLLMPNYASGREKSVDKNGVPTIEFDLSGYVVVKLDEETVRQFLGDLTEKYFPADGFANYQVIVSDNTDLKPLYSNKNIAPTEWEKNDSNISILDISDKNRSIIINSNIFSQNNKSNQKRDKPVAVPPPMPKMNKGDTVKVFNWDKQDEKTKELASTGVWALSVRHEQGSLEQFITNTRRKNLAISFGILGLLAASIILLFISTRRSQILAQKQMDFVSSVSHEFRTPLAVIYSAGENLADGVARKENQITQYGSLIKNEGRKLSKMVEQILEFAGANSGKKKYDFQKTSVSEVIENALLQCQTLLDEKQFKVEKDIAENLPEIFADKTSLSQAVENLIVNAVKFSRDEKCIKISAKNGDRKVKISVEDKGIGITPEDLRYIFEPFYRSKFVVDKQISGNGLGLNLVQQTVAAHGGRIETESETGKGSKFTIILNA